MSGGGSIEVDVTKQCKRMAILSVVLLIGGGLAALGAQSTDQAASEPPASETRESFLNDPDLGQSSDLSLGNKELFFRMMLAVVLVIALAVATLYLSKKVLPKVTKTSGKEIRVLETTYLGPRRTLHLVQVGDQKLLIGSTNESIATLAHVGDAWLDLPKQELDPTVNQ